MQGVLDTAGETVAIDCDDRRLWPLIAEAGGGCLTEDVTEDVVKAATIELMIENNRHPFTIRNATVLTRGAVRNKHAVVFDDACASGFSLRLEPHDDDRLRVFARYRPDPKIRLASMALRARSRLIARAVLLQYPVLWWAGVRGRPPLHVSALTSGFGTAVLAGPGGVGKSTLLQREISRGAAATCDNLAVSDGLDVFGMVEPIRAENGTGRRVTHGRRESPWPRRVTCLRAERVVVVRLDDVPVPSYTPVHPEVAVRSLIAGTYMAGELRRYWAFAATLALATGRGPVQPQIEQVATRMCTSLPCHLLTLSRRAVAGLSDVFAQAPEGLLQ